MIVAAWNLYHVHPVAMAVLAGAVVDAEVCGSVVIGEREREDDASSVVAVVENEAAVPCRRLSSSTSMLVRCLRTRGTGEHHCVRRKLVEWGDSRYAMTLTYWVPLTCLAA